MFCLEKWKIAVAMLAAAVVMMIFTMKLVIVGYCILILSIMLIFH